MALPLASRLRLKPLVRIKSVPPSGLTAVVMGWSAVKSGRSGRSGFNGCNVEPLAAVGVMLMPVGRLSPALFAGACDWAVATNGTVHEKRATARRKANVWIVIVSSVRPLIVSIPYLCSRPRIAAGRRGCVKIVIPRALPEGPCVPQLHEAPRQSTRSLAAEATRDDAVLGANVVLCPPGN